MVSIIVPVYNTARYLPRCIRSLIGQSHSDLEIILVNDGSTDNSAEICRRYAARDNRIRFIDKHPNEGVDRARFSGLAVAKGEYVVFVDSDDWMEPDGIATLYSHATREDCDIVIGACRRVLSTTLGIHKESAPAPTKYLGRRIGRAEMDTDLRRTHFGSNIIPVSLWSKIYRRDLFDLTELKPTGLRFGEDLILDCRLFSKSSSVFICDTVVYNYRWGG